MIYLLLAILSSALVSVIMRLSTDRVKGNVSMLAMNYLTCLVVAGAYAGFDLFPQTAGVGKTLGMGALNGVLYLGAFVLLQLNVKKNGVVLSAIFMKLGLLVPMVLSIFLFGEMPEMLQIVGFVIAIAAIFLINMGSDKTDAQFKAGLILLLLAGGSADAMSKVFEELGTPALSSQFLLYTFAAALVLSLCMMLARKERPGKMEVLFGLFVGIPNYFSSRFLLKSLESVPAVIVYPTNNVGTILAVTIAGLFLFREKLGKRQWTAIGVILVALVLLNI